MLLRKKIHGEDPLRWDSANSMNWLCIPKIPCQLKFGWDSRPMSFISLEQIRPKGIRIAFFKVCYKLSQT